MSRLALLAKPHWKELLALPGVGDLPTSALVAADSFFDFVRSHGLALPRSADVAFWCQGQTGADPVARLGSLRQAMEVCAPSFVATVAGAQGLLEKTSSAPLAQARDDQMSGSGAGGAAMRPAAGVPWDPIAPPARRPPRPRKVSVAPCAPPADWQEALRRAAHGLPSNGVAIGSRAIVIRMREKLCQLAWSAVGANLPVELSEETVNCYHTDLTERLVKKKEHDIRWATLRASIEELHRFARYTGQPTSLVRFLGDRMMLLATRENSQTALKFFELARTGNTTDSVLDKADDLLEQAGRAEDPRKRHQLRNGACILGLYPIAPLRNASADLVFGETLFWRDKEWVIDTHIQKTKMHNPEPFVMPLLPEHGRFIDAVLLSDRSPSLLPKLRQDVMTQRRQLFVLFDGRPTATTYIPRIYKALTGNSLTTARTMLHTDLAIRYGAAGTQIAMMACHQKSTQVAEKYQAEEVALHAVLRRQATGAARRAAHAAAAEAPAARFSADL